MPRKGVVTTNPLYWMPVNISEWLVKMAGGLTTEQFGALTLLVLTAWQQDPPCTLPSDVASLAKVSGLGSRWARSSEAVLDAAKFYPGRGGRLVADWLRRLFDEQLEKFNHRSIANAANRAKRDQHELGLGGTDGGTNGGTVRTANRVQKEEVRELKTTAVTPRVAPALESARAAGDRGGPPRLLTDILAGIPGVDPKIPVA